MFKSAIPAYKFIISKTGLEKIREYQEKLAKGEAECGSRLAEILDKKAGFKYKKNLAKLSIGEFIEYLVQAKKQTVFAESKKVYDDKLFSFEDYTALAEIGASVPVTIYDDCARRKNALDDLSVTCYEQEHESVYLFVSGALLGIKDQDRNIESGPDLDKVLNKETNEIDQTKYDDLMESRLLPLLMHANATAKAAGKKACVTTTGIGCGEFAGAFKGKMDAIYEQFLQNLCEKHKDKLTNIGAIYFYNHAGKENKTITIDGSSLDLVIRKKPDSGEKAVSLVDLPEKLDKKYKDYMLFSLIAGDGFAVEGNDYGNGLPMTDEGAKAGGSNLFSKIYNVAGEYCKKLKRYFPAGLSDDDKKTFKWNDLKKDFRLTAAPESINPVVDNESDARKRFEHLTKIDKFIRELAKERNSIFYFNKDSTKTLKLFFLRALSDKIRFSTENKSMETIFNETLTFVERHTEFPNIKRLAGLEPLQKNNKIKEILLSGISSRTEALLLQIRAISSSTVSEENFARKVVLGRNA